MAQTLSPDPFPSFLYPHFALPTVPLCSGYDMRVACIDIVVELCVLFMYVVIVVTSCNRVILLSMIALGRTWCSSLTNELVHWSYSLLLLLPTLTISIINYPSIVRS